jgi:HNH endonuclease
MNRPPTPPRPRPRQRSLTPIKVRPAVHENPMAATALDPKPPAYKKKAIPQALREAVWIHHCGRVFERKCTVEWCQNMMTVYDFQAGHNVPESRGGETTLDNLQPICSRCNLSMGDRFTIDEWVAKFRARPVAPKPVPIAEPVLVKKGFWSRFLCR